MHVLTHGGAGSNPNDEDATHHAALIAHEAIDAGQKPLDAACHATAHLEDDPRFNAGTGSHVRNDRQSTQMDAACMDHHGTYGAVAVIERIRHPIFVARHVADTKHLVLAGHGAYRFAKRKGVPEQEPPTEPSETPSGTDTVGCVLHAGDLRFAAALSSGGTKNAPPGRVGDVPLPGAGLHAGPSGAVCATGHGETIARRMTALRAYERLENGEQPTTILDDMLQAFPKTEALGLLIVNETEGAGGWNRTMAFTNLTP